MKENAKLKDRLREALDDAGMKPIELSERAGIPKSMISYYLNGKTTPKADRIYTISVALGVSEAWLLGYDVPKSRVPDNKKNDQLTKLIVRMRQDTKFYNIVEKLDQVPPDQLENIAGLLAGLLK
jgi:transcriptional regulator with XRE-family HTH domain